MPTSYKNKQYTYIKNEVQRERDRISKRKRMAELRMRRLEGKRCLLCTIRLDKNCKHGRIYCDDCYKRFYDETRRDRWRRYYYRTLKPRKLEWKKVKNKELGGVTYIGK